jgi:cell division protein FtsI/penicillin-binding protein 2
LPGEAMNFLQSPYQMNPFTDKVGWPAIQLANISFGQGISVSALQLADAYAAVANGGVLMQPHIIRAIRANGVQTLVAPVAIRRVISPQVAAMVRSILGTVVQTGTGGTAQIADFSVGGKTGSAQIAGRHGYEAGKFAASFAGMYPLSNPRLVVVCTIYEPQGLYWGATDAAPVVHDIGRYAMLEMHVPPDDPQAVDWADRGKIRPQPSPTRVAGR